MNLLSQNTLLLDRTNKIEILDSLRAFAALSVCFYHFICTTTGYIHNETTLSIFQGGKYGVQLFFVISGFIIPWSMYHAGYKPRFFLSFFLKRLARLEPPYICSVVLALVILFVRENFLGRTNDHIDISFKQIGLHFFYLVPFFEGYQWLNQVYWTLAVEFQYYLFIALIYMPLLTLNQWGKVALIVVGCIPSLFSSSAFLPFWLPVFWLGIVLFLYLTGHLERLLYVCIMVGLMALCFYRYPVTAVLYALIPIVCIHFIRGKKIPVLHFLGNCSYSIYLIHPLIGASFINLLSHKFVNPYEKPWVILSGVVLTLAGALIMYWLVERPSRRLSASIKYNKKSEPATGSNNI
jgi:peptidoglycan/LPS O-acetylase OafA/YrhL